MRKSLYFCSCLMVLVSGCSLKTTAPTLQDEALVLSLQEQNERFEMLSQNENFDELLFMFRQNCAAPLTQKVYANVCEQALHVNDAKAFFKNSFELKKIQPNEQRSMLTGYYEPLLHGSLKKTERFKYPVYGKPKDLVMIVGENDKKMRGRSVKGKMMPYFTREEIGKRKLNAEVLCYVDDKIDLFFMEVQGSGRVELENGNVIFIGYADSNGHAYKSLGREMINRGIFNSVEEVSLQSIRAWLIAHPSQIDTLLNTNPSYVFFRRMEQRATGSLGLVLTPERSVAVDRAHIPLGSLLVVKSESPNYNVEKFVFAQDTGGAIKGPNRADMFMGYGERAQWIAGELKAPLELWIMQPKF